MTNKKKKEEIRTDTPDLFFEETLRSIKADIRLTLSILVFFIILALFARFILEVAIPFFVFIILSVWALIYFSYNFFIKYQKNREELCNFHFRNNFIDIILLTVIIHYLGGVEWIGGIFYLLVFAWTSNTLSKKKVMALYLSALFFYSTLILLEYFQIIPHRPIFGPSLGYFQNPTYILIQVLSLTAVLFFIIETYGTFSETLRKKQENLIEAQKETEEARKVLEIRVKARTRELQELAGKQEEIIKERTEEIQGKMREAEVFHKLAVGRELKMIELKKEIKKLEEKLKEKK